MSGNLLLKIHLYLSAFFAPYILLMAIAGTCYLLGAKGSSTRTLVGSINTEGREIKKESVEEHAIRFYTDYSFEYVKAKEDYFVTRPATRDYYLYKKDAGKYLIFKVSPNFLAKIIEAHKGHGPKLLKWYETILGFVLIFILLSGVWMSLMVKRDKKITWILMGSGTLVLSVLFFFL